MRKLFTKYLLNARKGVCIAASLSGILISQSAFAQANEGEELLGAAASSMANIGILLGRVVQVALLIGALVTLAMAIINVMKGEREAASKIAWWVIGLGLGFAFITIIVNRFSAV